MCVLTSYLIKKGEALPTLRENEKEGKKEKEEEERQTKDAEVGNVMTGSEVNE